MNSPLNTGSGVTDAATRDKVIWDLEDAKRYHWEAFEGDSSGLVDDSHRASANQRLWAAIDAALEAASRVSPSVPTSGGEVVAWRVNDWKSAPRDGRWILLRDAAGDEHRLFWSKHYSIHGLGGCWSDGFLTMSDLDFTGWSYDPASPPIPADGRDAIRVRALEWQEVWAGANEDIPAWFACDPSGWNRQINFAGEVAVRSHADAPADKLAAKMAAVQAEYRDRVLSAIETDGSGRDAGLRTAAKIAEGYISDESPDDDQFQKTVRIGIIDQVHEDTAAAADAIEAKDAALISLEADKRMVDDLLTAAVKDYNDVLAERDKLREALEPFKDAAELLEGIYMFGLSAEAGILVPDTFEVPVFQDADGDPSFTIKAGDFRRARAALHPTEADHG